MPRFRTPYDNISLFDLIGYHISEVKQYVAEIDGYDRIKIEYRALNDTTSKINNYRETMHLCYDNNKIVRSGYWLR